MLRTNLTKFLVVMLLGTFTAVYGQEAPVEKITFDDHIKPIFREHCTSCHHAQDKSSGLALDTYGATLEGGSGGKIVQEGNVDGSRLVALVAHTAQPFMPPEQDKIPEAQINLLKKWVEQGMPENSGSSIKKPKANIAMLSTTAIGRPEGAPPLPETVMKQPPVFTPKSAAISAIAASPWAPLVAVGGQEQVVLYHTETGALLGILPFPEGEPQSIRFSRDGQLILVGGGRHSHSGYAVLYSLKTGERITRVGDELDIVMAADISEDNSKIALAGPQKMVRVYNTATGELRYEMKKHTDWIYAVRFSPDGVLLATADRSNGLVVWEADTGRLYLDLVGHKNEIRSIAWRPDSSALISSSMDGTVKFWELNEGKPIKSWDAHGGGVCAVDICNDGTIVTTGRDNKVKVWDAAGNPAGEMPALAEAGLEVAVSVDSKQVIAGDWAGNVVLWERANPANQKPLAANPPTLQMVIASGEAQLSQNQQLIANTSAAMASTQQQLAQMEQQVKTQDDAMNQTNGELANAVNTSTQLKAEVELYAKKILELEAMLVEAKKVHGEKTIAMTQMDTKVTELTAKKTEIEKTKTAMVAAMQPMTEAANQAKTANDAAQAKLAQSVAQLETAKTDLAKFEEYRAALAKKDAEMKAQLEQITAQLAQIQSETSQDKATVDSMAGGIAKLQEQLAALQQQMQAEEAKRKTAADAMAAKEKAAAELKAKVEQLQAEAATTAEQKAVIDKAFPKQP